MPSESKNPAPATAAAPPADSVTLNYDGGSLVMPVVRGSARHGSKTDLFLGNGDVLELSAEEA